MIKIEVVLRSVHLYFVLVLVQALASACADEASNVGQENGPCTADGRCDGDLICLAGICVRDQSTDSGPPPPWPDAIQPWPDGAPPPLPDAKATDAPSSPDKGPKPDLGPLPDLPPPKPDTGTPTNCLSWSDWSCIKWPQLQVACWATCSSSTGAVWCDGVGNCQCTGKGPCATVSVDLSQPCEACKTAFEVHGCCK